MRPAMIRFQTIRAMKQVNVKTRFQLLAISFAITASANAQVGQTALPFLRIEPDARTAALGGAGSTLLDGGYAGFWNPALLGYQQGRNVGFTYSDWLPGVGRGYSYQHLTGNYALPGRNGSVSGYLTYFNLGNQIAVDDAGFELGTFGNYQMAAGLSYGRNLARRISLGAGAKVIYSSLGAGQLVDGMEISPASSMAADLGGLFRSDTLSLGSRLGEFRAAATLSNFGPGITYMDGQSRSPLPLSFRFGLAFDVLSDRTETHKLTISADVSRILGYMEKTVRGGDTTYVAASPFKSVFNGWGGRTVFNGNRNVQVSPLEQMALGAGLEYWYSGLLALRGGYYLENPEYGDRRYVTAGVGVRFKMAEADFSYLHTPEERHPMANTVRLSMKIHLQDGRYHKPLPNRMAPIRVVEEEAPMPAWTLPSVDVQLFAGLAPATRVLPSLPLHTVNAQLASADFDLRGFDTMSSELSEEFRAGIKRVASLMGMYEELKLQIQGHADSRGNPIVNNLLGESRSRAVWLELTDSGIASNRLSITGFGDNRPISSNETTRGRADNRRVELRLIRPSVHDLEETGPPAQLSDLSLATYLMGRDSALVRGTTVPRRIELRFDGPLNRGNEFPFTILESDNPAILRSWSAGLVNLLQANPDVRLLIATNIGYPTGSHRFQEELAKARSEKIKMLMVLMGAESSRIDVIRKGDADWNARVTDVLDARYAERVWIWAVPDRE